MPAIIWANLLTISCVEASRLSKLKDYSIYAIFRCCTPDKLRMKLILQANLTKFNVIAPVDELIISLGPCKKCHRLPASQSPLPTDMNFSRPAKLLHPLVSKKESPHGSSLATLEYLNRPEGATREPRRQGTQTVQTVELKSFPFLGEYRPLQQAISHVLSSFRNGSQVQIIQTLSDHTFQPRPN